MAQVIDFLDKSQLSKYYVTDKKKFLDEVHSRMLAVVASSFFYWKKLAQGAFSKPTADKYIAGMFWDPSNLNNIKLGVSAGSITDMLEFGFPEYDMKPKILKGKTSVRVPIEPSRRPGTMVDTNDRLIESSLKKVLTLNVGNPIVSVHSIIGLMRKYEKTHVLVKNTRARGVLIRKSKPIIRTVHITSPAWSWRHPGYKGAKLIPQVAAYVENVLKPKFMQDLLTTTSSIEY